MVVSRYFGVEKSNMFQMCKMYFLRSPAKGGEVPKIQTNHSLASCGRAMRMAHDPGHEGANLAGACKTRLLVNFTVKLS